MKRRRGLAYNAGVFMGVPLEHLDVAASDEEESKMAILMADRIDAQMINPTEILEHSDAAAAVLRSAVLLRSLARGLAQRRRLRRRVVAAIFLLRTRHDLHPSLLLSLSVSEKLVFDLSDQKMRREREREGVEIEGTRTRTKTAPLKLLTSWFSFLLFYFLFFGIIF